MLTKSKLPRLFLASLIALNGLPVLNASNAAPTDRKTVLQDWAKALGMSGDLRSKDEIASIEYWATGTVNLDGQECALTEYHASIKYQVPGMRIDFTCVDRSGRSHHQIQVVADKLAWNETEPGGGTTSAMGAVDERLVQLWTGPVALVKAAHAAGSNARISADAGKTVVTFPVPGVADATLKATLSAKHQAEQVEARLGSGTIQTLYSDYAELNGSDLKFDTFFPHHIIQKQGDVTLLDLSITRTSTSRVDLVMHVPDAAENTAAAATAAPIPPNAPEHSPKNWKDKQAWVKLDQSLRQTVTKGCVVPPSVIIRTKPGYRAGLSASLKQHGDKLSGEFPIINAVGAKVSCSDLETLAGFDSTLSVSVNARVMTEQVLDPPTTAPLATPAPDPSSASGPVAAVAPDRNAIWAAVMAPAPDPTSAISDTPSAPTTDPSAAPAVAPDAQAAVPVDLPSPRDAEGQAAALLQAPLLQTLLGDNYDQLRNQAPAASSIGIAIIDSGIEPGPDFRDRITAFYDFTHGDVQAASPSDGYGHGTHVAGLAASRYVGVNPTARLIGLKVLNQVGQGTSDAVLRAIEFAIVNKDLLNIQVLNLSLGHPIYEHAATDPLVQAVESAVRSGLVVVVSAGNLGLNPAIGLPGYAGIVSPGNAPSVYSIGAVRTHNTATRDDDEIALFSSRGPTWYDGFAKPDFAAPGQNLLSVAAAGSTLRLAAEANGNTGNYMRLTGTSMAAGVASGFASLALQANPRLTPNALKAVIEFSSIDVNGADRLSQGAGAVSGGAIALAQSIDTTAQPGASWLISTISPSTVIAGETMPWVQRMVWADFVASGSALLATQRLAWSLGVVWGQGDDDNIVWGNNVVWGDDADNIVWGNNVAWGNDAANIVWGNDEDNIVWGNNIVWGKGLVAMSLDDDNIVWGNSLDDNIVWGNDDDNIVWGNSVGTPSGAQPATADVAANLTPTAANTTHMRLQHAKSAGRTN